MAKALAVRVALLCLALWMVPRALDLTFFPELLDVRTVIGV